MRLRKINKKGQKLSSLLPAVVAFLIVAIIMTIGGSVLRSIYETQCVVNATTDECNQIARTVASNATEDGLQSIELMSGYLPTLAIVIILAVIIGIIIAYVAGKFGGSGTF